MATPLIRRPEGNGASPQVLPAAGRYRLDLSHTAVTFRTRHLFGLGAVSGTMAVTGGEITINSAVPQVSGMFGKLSAGPAMPAWEQVPTRQQSIRQAASLTVKATIVVAEAIVLLLRAVLALVIAAAGTGHGHRLPAPGPERTRHGRGADGRPDPAGQSLRLMSTSTLMADPAVRRRGA